MDLLQSTVLFLLTALTLFGFYGLLAWGLGLIFGQLGVVNVAHGDFAMVGAFTMFALPHVPFFLRLLIAVAVAIVLGFLTERFLLRKLYVRGMLATLLAMWGVGIVIRQGLEAWFGTTPGSVRPPVQTSITVLGVQYPSYRLLATAISLVLIAAGLLIIYRTTLGLRLRASIDNRQMAALLGISPSLMITGTFIVGTVLAVMAGALQSPMLGVTPSVGLTFLAPAFFAVLVGKPGSLGGPILGAAVVALLQTALRTFFTETIAGLLFFVILILLIALRPQGLNWRIPKWNTTRKPLPAQSTQGNTSCTHAQHPTAPEATAEPRQSRQE